MTPYLACFLPFCTSFCTFQLTPRSVPFVFRLHFSSITGSSFYLRPPQPFYLSIYLSIYTVYYLISYLIRFACIELFALYFRLFRFFISAALQVTPSMLLSIVFFFHVVLCCSQLFNEFVFISPQACSRNSLKLKINIYNF